MKRRKYEKTKNGWKLCHCEECQDVLEMKFLLDRAAKNGWDHTKLTPYDYERFNELLKTKGIKKHKLPINLDHLDEEFDLNFLPESNGRRTEILDLNTYFERETDKNGFFLLV